MSFVYPSFIGWLKNFITDRNRSTQNLIDSYIAATMHMVRRAPAPIKAKLLARWAQLQIASANTTFLQSAEQILGRSRGRAGMHEVHMPTLARYNSRRIEQPALELQRWFSSVQEGLDIRELTRGSRGGIRKNGHRIVPGCHVSYYEGTTLRIGVLSTVYVGSRPSAPEDPVCAVCVFRRFRSVRKYVNFRDCGMLIVSLLGARGELDYVCSTRMQHLYLRAIWEDPDEEDLFALVRMEAL